MSRSMNDGQGFQQRRHLLDMLDDGLVMVHVDPRGADVIVPQRFKSDPVLRLNLAYMFRLPALDIGAEGIYAVLSFDKQNFGCTLPWSCVFAVTRPDANHEGIVWPESAPASCVARLRAPGELGRDPTAERDPRGAAGRGAGRCVGRVGRGARRGHSQR